MKFQPKSEEEVKKNKLMEEGDYDFIVVNAENVISKAGNEMIKLKLNVWDKQGKEKCVFDYLLESMDYKLRHFCEITGLIDTYNSGDVDAMDCLNKSGKAHIIIDIGKEKPGGGFYDDRNAIKDYVKSEIKQTKKDDKFESDDIPF